MSNAMKYFIIIAVIYIFIIHPELLTLILHDLMTLLKQTNG